MFGLTYPCNTPARLTLRQVLGAVVPGSLALKAWQQQDYKTASQQLSNILGQEPENPSLKLALAISYWEHGPSERAQSVSG